MSADIFVQSVKKGYDSKDFIEKLMKSETAKHLYNKTKGIHIPVGVLLF